MNEQKKKVKRNRSPQYPIIDLETAISKAHVFYDCEKRGKTFTHIACSHWGYAKGSSSGQQVLAAVTYYGLLIAEGSADKRQVMLSEDALRIILDARENSQERDEYIRKCALNPKVHKQIFDNFPDGLPSDETLRHYLIFSLSFNEKTVTDFIKQLKSTFEFASLYESDILDDNNYSNEIAVENATSRRVTQDSVQNNNSFVKESNKNDSDVNKSEKTGGIIMDQSQPFAIFPSPDGVKFTLFAEGDVNDQSLNKLIKYLKLYLKDDEDDK